MLKSIAKVKGYNVKEKAKNRTAFTKKLAKLESGEINAGEFVVPVEYYVTTIQSDGSMVNTAKITSS